MKRIFILFITIGSLFLLIGCANKIPVSNDEFEFSEMINSLKKGVISIEAKSLTEENIGTGVVYNRKSEGMSYIYYVITATEVVEDMLTIKIYTNETSSFTGHKLHTYDEITILTFESNQILTPIDLKKVDNPEDLIARQIFSIGTPISQSYFNMPTNPALVSNLIEGNRIVHSTNLNNGHLGSPLFLKSSGQLIGINVVYLTYENDRNVNRINEALLINDVIDLINEGA